MAKKTYRDQSKVKAALDAARAASDVDKFVAAANDGDKQALYWIRRLERYGVTASLLQDIVKIINRAQMIMSIVVVEDGENLRLDYRHDFPEHHVPAPEIFYAINFMSYLGAGALDGLKRCSLKECRKYFVGNAKAVWCSDKCGSKYRARRMRKRNKERQML